MNTTIIIVAVALGALLFEKWYGVRGLLPIPLRNRTCQGRGWKRHFPHTPNREIREFLLFFVKSFAFSDNEKLKLSPNDKILEIYKALYPSKWMPDALEFETLAKDLRHNYSVELGNIWRDDLTLGELFTECQKKATPNTPLVPSR